MARHIHLQPHLTIQQLDDCYRTARDPIERSHWQFLWLLSRGLTATAVAAVTGYAAYWIGQIARRYNDAGPEGVRVRRHRIRTSATLLSQAHQKELWNALMGPEPAATIGVGARWLHGLVSM